MATPVAGYQAAPGVALSDDELRFIGWWLTDGTTNRANGTVIITQSHRYQEHVAAIDACLAGCRLQHRRHEQAERGDEGFRTHYGQTKWVIQRTSLGAMAGWRGYEELAPWLDKDLSPALEDMTRDQLAVLLHARAPRGRGQARPPSIVDPAHILHRHRTPPLGRPAPKPVRATGHALQHVHGSTTRANANVLAHSRPGGP